MPGDGRHNFSVTDITYRAGFNNRNSFYRVFKEKNGLTPSQYKAALRPGQGCT
jgi:AraC-like DNA-binding protein